MVENKQKETFHYIEHYRNLIAILKRANIRVLNWFWLIYLLFLKCDIFLKMCVCHILAISSNCYSDSIKSSHTYIYVYICILLLVTLSCSKRDINEFMYITTTWDDYISRKFVIWINLFFMTCDINVTITSKSYNANRNGNDAIKYSKKLVF